MAGKNESVNVTLKLERAKQFKHGVDGASRSVRRLGNQSSVASKRTAAWSKVNTRATRGLRTMGRVARNTGIAVGALAIVGIKQSLNAASAYKEQASQAEVVFGSAAQKNIVAWADKQAMAHGLSARASVQSVNGLGAFFQQAGKTNKESAKLGKQFTELGADLASFNDTSPEDALQALQSGLSGQAKPLRRYKIFLNEAKVSNEAVALGIAKKGDKLTDEQKILARSSIIMKSTTKAQGDYARTAGGAANQQRSLGAQVEDLKNKFGKGLLPMQEQVQKSLIKFTDGMLKGTGAGGRFAKRLERVRDSLTKFIKEMRTGTGQGGRFVKRVKEIYEGVKPIVVWFAKAAFTVGKFVTKHPQLLKVAAGLFLVSKAVKAIRFTKALLGIGDLVKGGKSAVRILKRVMGRGGAQAGAGAAENMAASAGSGLGPALDKNKAKFTGGRWRTLGRSAGRVFGLAAAAVAALMIGKEIIDALDGIDAFKKARQSNAKKLDDNTLGVTKFLRKGDKYVPGFLKPNEDPKSKKPFINRNRRVPLVPAASGGPSGNGSLNSSVHVYIGDKAVDEHVTTRIVKNTKNKERSR